MTTLLRIAFLLVLPAIVLLVLGPPEAIKTPYRASNAVSFGRSAALASLTPIEVNGEPGLWVRARTAGERLRTWKTEDERLSAVRDLEDATAALSRQPEADALPWRQWILDSRYTHPELAVALFRSAAACLGPDALPLARELDDGTSPDDLRVAIHEVYWSANPLEASPRLRRLLARPARAQDLLRPRLVRDVLAIQQGSIAAPEADRLLDLIATKETYGDRTRRAAIDALVARNVRDSAASLHGVFLSESQSLLVRSAALVAILKLDVALGRDLLKNEVPEVTTQPILYETFRRLRAEYGLPNLPRPPAEFQLEIPIITDTPPPNSRQK